MRSRLKNLFNNCVFVFQFAIDDFKNKYAGSGLGIAWAFLQPIITMVLYWFVFELGFKSQPVADFPFILWLMSGLVPWFFFSEAIANATASLADYSYLVKKVLFNIHILPLAKVVSMLLVQGGLLAFMLACFFAMSYFPDAYYLQLPIYIIYMIILAMGFAYLTSTLYVFFKDTVQIISIVIQTVFWLTPIVWNLEAMPEAVQKVIVYNPIYYVVTGYRNVFIYKESLVHTGPMIAYYWIVAIVIFFLGYKLFSKCKDHFADVL